MVFNIDNIDNIYIYPKSIDFRTSMDGLILLIDSIGLDVYTDSIFIFRNKNKNKIKIIFHDGTGFWMCYKRLDRGVFFIAQNSNKDVYEIQKHELEWFLDAQKIYYPMSL